ncbi:MAG: glycosyltransferase family 4 protein [Fibrobacteres bacterium]|nr:glycosyltransferase family 4 protein [Fibrobacterota bacterium]
MHILTLTTLFPNAMQPVHGLFIRARMEDYTRRHGHRWTVVAPVPWYPKLPFATSPAYDRYARVPALEQGPGYQVHHPRYLITPKYGMRYYGAWMARGIRSTVARIHARDPIDVIDGHYIYPDANAALEAGRMLGVPVVLSARGTDLNFYPQLPAIRPLLRKNLAACDHLICVCSDLKKVALELGMEDARVSVIGNGVDTDKFRPVDAAAARAKLGLPADARIILSVGHLIERKGFHILLRAFAKLRDRGGLRVAIVGDGEMRQELKRLAADLGIAGSVIFPGAVGNSALPDWYGACDLFVMASSREGWPNAVTEALACGLPLVGTKVWGMPEIVTSPELGLLIDEREPDALAQALERALARAWDRPAIARQGGARTWEAVSAQLHPIFTRLAGK